MGDSVKEAFAARLRKKSEQKATGEVTISRSEMSSSSLASLPQPAAAAGPSQPEPISIKLNGWLMKQSTEQMVKRWQRRFFSIESETIAYSMSPQEEPLKKYPLKTLTQVKLVDNKKFEVQFGGKKTYILESDSRQEALKWVAAIESVLAKLQKSSPGSADDFDDNASFTSSAKASKSTTGNSRQPAFVPDLESVWELDTDELDRKFENWFHGIEDQSPAAVALSVKTACMEMQKQLQAASKPKINHERAMTIANEYIGRLAGYLTPYLHDTDFCPEFVEILAILVESRQSILSSKTSGGTPGGTPGDLYSPQRHQSRHLKGFEQQPWKSQLQNMSDILTADFELSLVEKLNSAIEDENVWEMKFVQNANIKLTKTHGPAIQLCSLATDQPTYLTSFLPNLSSQLAKTQVETRMLRNKYPLASPLFAELLASAIVALFNVCYRKAYKRMQKFTAASTGNVAVASSWTSLLFRSSRRDGDSPISPKEGSLSSLNTDLQNSVAFSNELYFLSELCVVHDTEYPEIYVNCISTLRQCFSDLTKQFISVFIEFEVYQKYLEISIKAGKTWKKRSPSDPLFSPMKTILDSFKPVLSEMVLATHMEVHGLILRNSAQLLVSVYLLGMLTVSGKEAKRENLVQRLVQDEIIFLEFFMKLYKTDFKSETEILGKLKNYFSSPSKDKSQINLEISKLKHGDEISSKFNLLDN
jgi:PH domain